MTSRHFLLICMFVAIDSAFYYDTQLVSNNFIKVSAAYFTSRKQLKSLKIKAKIKNIWFGVFALDRVNLYINYT